MAAAETSAPAAPQRPTPAAPAEPAAPRQPKAHDQAAARPPAPRIEDHALIGDCQTAALVANNGSIDWLCWPRFDSDAVFAALLGTPENGHWRLAPEDARASVKRRYQPGTLILETDFECAEGAVRLIDFMPVRESVSDLVRIVVGLRGDVAMAMELVLRFDYGITVPWVTHLPEGGLRAVAGPDMVLLHASTPTRGEDMKTVARFRIAEGQRATFVLTYASSFGPPPEPIDAEQALKKTQAYWRDWSSQCNLTGPWADAVVRSLITLKALTYMPTGGIVAAPTTSLPEQLGGPRNWDYRFCWLRDATFTLLSLMGANYYKEADEWRHWLQRAIAGSPEQAQIMYGLAGERRLAEWTCDWLPGYRDSRPVRIGNAAAGQLQLDVYGEVMDALHHARKGGLGVNPDTWAMQRALLEHLATIWTEPDEGIWEMRSGRRHFTHSKVMAWVAADRAIKDAEALNLPAPLDRWRALRDTIHDDVWRRGFDAQRNCFVQSYGSDQLDASLLLLPLMGFVPADDPRMIGTVAAIERELMSGGLVLRYRTDQAADGLPAGEGVFLPCSFWLADVYTLQGRQQEAQALFERLLALRNDVGLLAEEYDTQDGCMLGNFPQAFTHVGLVNSALNLSRARSPATQRGSEEAAATPARAPSA